MRYETKKQRTKTETNVSCRITQKVEAILNITLQKPPQKEKQKSTEIN